MYLLNTYLLGTVVANRRGQALLITAFACPLVFSFFHTLIHPSLLSLFIIPADLVTGGVTGLGLISNELTDVPISYFLANADLVNSPLSQSFITSFLWSTVI